MSNARSLSFKQRPQGRYWWFQSRKHNYVPAVFSVLEIAEWQVIEEWYAATDAEGNAGEANVPALGLITGMLDSSSVPNVVQLGHHQGFSSLLLGFTMRRMGFKQSVFTVDISEHASDITKYWIKRAQLADYVSVNTSSSDDPHRPKAARDYFSGGVAALFVDSSHQYDHTLRELDLWFPVLRPFGLVFLHDVSVAASGFNQAGQGGVLRALDEWLVGRSDASSILLNRDVIFGKNPVDVQDLVYQDGCGLGIIQKRSPARLA